MGIVAWVLQAYGVLTGTASLVAAAHGWLEHNRNCSAEELFEKCYRSSFERSKAKFAHLAEESNRELVGLDDPNVGKAIKALSDSDLASGPSRDALIRSTAPLFRTTVIIPGFASTDEELDRVVSGVLADAVEQFVAELPTDEQAYREVMLAGHENMLAGQQQQSAVLGELQEGVAELLHRQNTRNAERAKQVVLQSGRPSLGNPFRLIRAEDFNHDYALLARLFHVPSDYDEIRGRPHVVLAGGRGSGKSMILRCLSVDTELARAGDGRGAAGYAESGLDYFGVYLKLARGYFHDLQPTEVMSREAVVTLFQHRFNMQLAKALTRSLASQRTALGMDSRSEQRVAEAISQLVNPSSETMSTFDALSGLIDQESQAIGLYVGDSLLGQGGRYEGHYTYAHEFPGALCEVVVEEIGALRGSRIYFLLDEFENLLPYQQQVVNTIIKLRPESLCLKIAVRNLGWKIQTDLQGEPVQYPRDYVPIVLDYEPYDQDYWSLLTGIARRRLQAEACAETDIERLLPELRLREEMGKSELDTALQEHLSARGEKLEALRGERVAELHHNLDMALAFRILRGQGRERAKRYSGLRTLAMLSSGIISAFMELCKVAFYLAEAHGIDARAGKAIPCEVQSEAAHTVSQFSLDQISKNIPETGEKLRLLVTDLGDIFRERLLFHESAPETLRMTLEDPQRLTAESAGNLARLLKDGVMWSVLHRRKAGETYRPKHSTQVRPDEYVLNRIYAPALEISHRARWRCPFTVSDLRDLVDLSRREVAKDRLVQRQRPAMPGEQAGLFTEEAEEVVNGDAIG